MSEAYSPLCPVILFTPAPGSDEVPHPMVTLPEGVTMPFTLRTDPMTNWYRMWFQFEIPAEQNPHNWGARMFAATFKTTIDSAIWTTSMPMTVSGMTSRTLFILQHRDLGDATDLWVGAWWDNGTYGQGAREDVMRYFTAHPAGGMHHTVPIRIT